MIGAGSEALERYVQYSLMQRLTEGADITILGMYIAGVGIVRLRRGVADHLQEGPAPVR